MSCGLRGPSISGSPALNALAFLNVDVDTARDRVFALLAIVADDVDLALTLCDFAVLDDAVDLRDDGASREACAPRTARRHAADRR